MKKRVLAFFTGNGVCSYACYECIGGGGTVRSVRHQKLYAYGQRHYCTLSQLAYRFKRYYQKCEGRTIA